MAISRPCVLIFKRTAVVPEALRSTKESVTFKESWNNGFGGTQKERKAEV